MSLNGNYKHRGKNENQKSKSHQSTRRDNSLGIDEFGIIRADDHSRSSDSVPFEDPSLHLTDDDTSARILEGAETSENDSRHFKGIKSGVFDASVSESEAVLEVSGRSENISSDLHLRIDELVADTTGISEDISKSSDPHLQNSSSLRQDETESLTEFEEIERLIQANTVEDSDGDLSDIPIDLEQQILSGRISRVSSRSSRSNRTAQRRDVSSGSEREDGNESSRSTEHRSNNQEINPASVDIDQSFTKDHLTHVDTGYGSEGQTTMPVIAEPSHQRSNDVSGDAADVSGDAADEANYNGHDADRAQASNMAGIVNSSQSFEDSTKESLNELFVANSQEDVEQLEDTDELKMDHFVVPTNRGDVGDTNQPNSLVATFGTTEDFEVLLKRQLEDIDDEENQNATIHSMDEESDREARGDFNGSTSYPARTTTFNRTKDNMTSTKRKPYFGNRSSPSPNRGTSPSPRTLQRSPYTSGASPRTKLKLSSKNSSRSPKESPKSEKNLNDSTRRSTGGYRSTRSPAASRVRRANISNGKRPPVSTLHRESSDELSVRSDMSQSELRSKLKEEAKNRKRDEQFTKELQNNYDALLMKYAQAENTIDDLRLGAKINLYASVPRPSQEAPTLPFEDSEIYRRGIHPQQAMTSGMGTRSESSPALHHSPLHSASSDTLVESSLQLPAAATKEFLKVALQLQAKDLQDKAESFGTLLKETDLSSPEKQQVMEKIEELLRNLERDYLAAIDEHAAEQERVRIATGGSIDQEQQFDPDRAMEADIIRLGQMVKDLRDHIASQTSPPTYRSLVPFSARSNEDERLHDDIRSSPDEDVDKKFNKLLKKYNHPSMDDGHTTAPSLVYSSPDEEEPSHSATRRHSIPNRYLEPPSQDVSHVTHEDGSPKQVPTTSPTPARRQKHKSSNHNSSSSPSPSRRSNSKLPRPVRTSSKDRPKTSPSGQSKSTRQSGVDKGTDSGFVGSESSRQSGAPQPAKVKLVSRAPAAVSVNTDVTKPKPLERKGRPASRASTTTTQRTMDSSPPLSRPPQPSSYIDRVGIYKPPSSYTVDDSVDDVSTTSTVREMLRPQSRSYSSSPPPAPTKPHSAHYPRGSKSGTSVKSRDSAKKSVASSTADSTLDMIRGEISKLRNEIKEAKQPHIGRPIHASTPRHPLVEKNISETVVPSDSETLQAIRTDIQALKDELQKQGQRRRRAGSDVHSTRSAGAPTVASHSDREGSARGRRVRRSRSLGRDDLSEVGRNDSSPETSSHRRRSRSQDRGGPWTGGYWTYVPPPPPVWGSVPAGRAYTRIHATDTAPSPTAVYTVPPVVHTAPIIGPPSNLIYVDPQQTASQSRVYIPSVSRSARIYTTPSKPQASIYIAPKSSPSSRRSVRKANIYIVESDDEQPLRRSHLSTLKRSSSLSRLNRDATLVALPDSRLNDSIERAERSAENLRSRSRSMYRSVRDNVYQAQLLADTM